MAEKIETGNFSEWLNASQSGEGADVPCGECRGCCTSAYFIHIGPDEKETLARVPKKLLFRAPGMPKGHVLMGYRENGHCPMFVDNACSIYAQRPRTCRDYDCRVFAATGLAEEGKPAIAEQAARWRFRFDTLEDRRRFDAVRAAAKFLEERAEEFPPGFLPGNATQRAALALRVHGVFLAARGKTGTRSAAETARAVMAACDRKGVGLS